MAEMEEELRAVQQGSVKPDHSGFVLIKQHGVYITRAADKTLVILWPYNLAHDDNYFEGCLFSDRVLTSDKLTASGPVRGGYPGEPRSWMTHLRVDRKISEHWYHVQDEMYNDGNDE